ncbi:hypothetical protein K461DRAFT_315808 [Myriangium duriaei CBS 260.36]|uniref:2EXR domain-containing protein n=1 Tax=Myriangium duriaei CBS 260.36 TaxID=1168546 RepID=A0A9P4MII5_9PEZI|nr:hypothetical protein K461DRAFT_315808 [Myriangium duriaei CBS 260.36]
MPSNQPASFTYFSKLPNELRLAIWKHALPDAHIPSFYVFRAWEEISLDMEEPLDKIAAPRIDLPLGYVNREAHGIAKKWVQNQGLSMRYPYEIVDGGAPRFPLIPKGNPFFVRPFDPEHHVLFIHNHTWKSFVDGEGLGGLTMLEPGLWDRKKLKHIAFTRSLLLEEPDRQLDGLWRTVIGSARSLSTVYVLVDGPIPLDPGQRQSWVAIADPLGSFVWDPSSLRFKFVRNGLMHDNRLHGIEQYCVSDGRHTGRSESLFTLLEHLGCCIGLALDHFDIKEFEIRPVYSKELCRDRAWVSASEG